MSDQDHEKKSQKNRHGLTRDVPDPVARAVRRDCGFACVVCGSLGMHYDHFEPEFVDCIEHNPDGIALLCADCHQDKTSGRLSKSVVAAARLRAKERWKDPAWRSQLYGKEVRLRIGSNVLRGPHVGLRLGSTPLLRIDAAVDDLEPWSLSGVLVHGAGEVARFEQNRVIACSGNWDVELAGKLLTFRPKHGEIVLELALGSDELGINRLQLAWPSGVRLTVDRSGDVVMENLRNTANNNELGRISFSKNTIAMSGEPRPEMQLVVMSGTGGARIGEMNLSGNEISGFGGVADLASFANVSAFLSDDMLKIQT